MSLTVDLDYDRFLGRSVSAFVSDGAQVLLASDASHDQTPPWVHSWDRLLLLNNPGSVTLYAFSRADPDQVPELRTRLDELAQGLSSWGALGSGAVNVVAVLTFAGPIEARKARSVTRLTPSRYFPGLRPSTWVVDLRSGVVHTAGLGIPLRGKPQGLELVEQALQADGHGASYLDTDVHELQRVHVERREAFYRLMRGRQPIATYALIAVNVLVYLWLAANGGPDSQSALTSFGALSPNLIQHGEWWRLFTSMFLHGSVTHILFNMVSLYAIGTLAERFYGSARFLAIYLGAGLIGSITSFSYAELSGHADILGVGASGAIFGVAGALITLRFQASDAIPLNVRQRVSSSMVPLVALNLIFLHFVPQVDNSAHIGGLIGGMLLSLLLPITMSYDRA